MLLTGPVFFWVIVIWVSAVGGSVGSFLNVVVYRLPAKLSLSHPGSHCPKCKHPIRWHDNVPVLGWFVLRGRCRDCGSRIPFRYPAVEALVAALLVVLVVTEGLSGGANLPARPAAVDDGVIFLSLTSAESAGIVGWHFLLLCTLLPAALIRYDGHPVPVKLFGPALVVGMTGSFFWPDLHPQPAMMCAAGPTSGIVDGLAGLCAGGSIGAGAWQLFRRSFSPATAWAGGLVGLFLGWQAAVVIVPLAAVCHAVLRPLRSLWPGWSRLEPVAWMAVLSLGWIVAWRHLAELIFGSVHG